MGDRLRGNTARRDCSNGARLAPRNLVACATWSVTERALGQESEHSKRLGRCRERLASVPPRRKREKRTNQAPPAAAREAGLAGRKGAAVDVDQAACVVCHSLEDDSNMLLCDGCDRGHHIYCVVPPLDAIPDGDWFCAACTASKNGASGQDDSRTTPAQAPPPPSHPPADWRAPPRRNQRPHTNTYDDSILSEADGWVAHDVRADASPLIIGMYSRPVVRPGAEATATDTQPDAEKASAERETAGKARSQSMITAALSSRVSACAKPGQVAVVCPEDAKGGDEIQVAAEGASMGVVAVSVPQGVMGGSVFHVELPVHAGADDCDPGLRRLANLVVNT